ncbi:MAG: MFS transporter [bacterium]
MNIFRNREILGWLIYDLANTIYSMNVVTLYFSQWLIIDLGQNDIVYSIAFSTSLLLTGLLAPAIGAYSDARANKHKLLFLFTILCCLSTSLIGQSQFTGIIIIPVALTLFIIANFSYQSSQALYNALLPSVAKPDVQGRVSGWGTALGYAGSIIGMLTVLPFVRAGGRATSFLPTGLLFLLLSIPTFLFVRDRGIKSDRPINIKDAYKKVIETVKSARRYPGLIHFLIAKAFYEDGIATAIVFMAVYAQQVMGMPDIVKVPFFILSTTFAITGSILSGYITDRTGPRRTLILVIAGWIISLTAIAITTSNILFWILGSLIGILLGAVWTSSRPLLLRLIPEGMEGESFGLFALSGKIAAITGPLLFGGIVLLAEPLGIIKYRIGIGGLVVMMIVGLVLLLGVKIKDKTE